MKKKTFAVGEIVEIYPVSDAHLDKRSSLFLVIETSFRVGGFER